MSFEDHISSKFESYTSAPFLFVGSGISRRYLNLPSWEELLQELSSRTDQPYSYYRSKADSNFPRIASELTHKFHEMWFNGAIPSDFKSTYDKFITKMDSPLKCVTADLIKSKSLLTTDENLLIELENFKNISIDGIITTNWDMLLEDLFDFETFIGQKELFFRSTHQIAESYKIHGCISNPNSLVFCHEDYTEFQDKNQYLAAKLLTIFIEHPIIFLGYSLQDSNINNILSSIIKCMDSDSIRELQNRLHFIKWNPGITEPTMTTSALMIHDVSLPITLIEVAEYTDLFNALSIKKRAFSAKLLRTLKDHIFELVKSNDPKCQIGVIDINDDTNVHDIEVVFGVGAKELMKPVVKDEKGIFAFDREDLLKDLLGIETIPIDPGEIILKLVPRLLKDNDFTPVFKYLKLADVDYTNLDTLNALPPNLKKYIEKFKTKIAPPLDYRKKAANIAILGGDVDDLISNYGDRNFLYYITLIPEKIINISKLRLRLQERWGDKNSYHPLHRSCFIKAICYLDYLENRR